MRIWSTIISHSAVTVRSLTRCPGLVQLIHGALYGLATETSSKTHFKVAPSFPGGTSQVCTEHLAISRQPVVYDHTYDKVQHTTYITGETLTLILFSVFVSAVLTNIFEGPWPTAKWNKLFYKGHSQLVGYITHIIQFVSI